MVSNAHHVIKTCDVTQHWSAGGAFKEVVENLTCSTEVSYFFSEMEPMSMAMDDWKSGFMSIWSAANHRGVCRGILSKRPHRQTRKSPKIYHGGGVISCVQHEKLRYTWFISG